MEISAEQLKKLNDGEYTVYDIRSETDRAYGFIPGSVHTTADELENNPPADRDKKIIIYCAHGVFSIDIADRLCEQGYEALSRYINSSTRATGSRYAYPAARTRCSWQSSFRSLKDTAK